MISKIENYFKFPRQRLTRHCEKFVSQNNLPSVFLNNKETDQSIIVYGFPALPVISHRKYAFDIVSLILGGGAASRMYLKISNELGLCYEIGTDNFSFSDTGVFSIYAYTSSKKLLPAIKAIRDEYARMFAEGITLKELKRAKNYFRGSYAINFEDSYEVARFLGDQAVSLGYAETPDEDMLKTEKVTRREVNSLIRELFDPVRARLAVTTDLGGSRGKVLKMKGELQEIIGG